MGKVQKWEHSELRKSGIWNGICKRLYLCHVTSQYWFQNSLWNHYWMNNEYYLVLNQANIFYRRRRLFWIHYTPQFHVICHRTDFRTKRSCSALMESKEILCYVWCKTLRKFVEKVIKRVIGKEEESNKWYRWSDEEVIDTPFLSREKTGTSIFSTS